MSNALTLITGEINAIKDDFMTLLSDRSIKFEQEAGFAVQILGGNDFALSVATSNRASVINAVKNIAAIGISLNPAKKQAYLVPRRVGQQQAICLDISYMGLMDLAMATGSIKWAQAELVRANDGFSRGRFDEPPTHTFNPFSKDRGEIIGVYVVVKTADGDYLTHTMEIGEVYDIRDRSEAWKSYVAKKIKSCPWVTDAGEMIKKTCVKQAYKYWPKTERLETAIHHLNTDGGEGLVAG
ncbi:recombinase RecT [Massilia phosphatilytica]